MGPARPTPRLVFRRYDAENLVDETRHVRSRLASTFQRNIHDQVVADRTWYPEPQHEPDFGLREFRFVREVVGRRTRGLHSHSHQAHGARLFGGVQSGREVPGQRQFRQMRAHLVHPIRTIGAQL